MVDDGSDDDTSKMVEELMTADARIDYLRHDTNRGAQAARNTGIRTARGKWLAFLDSDDQWLPNSLEMRLDAVGRDESRVVHSECYVVRKDGILRQFGVPPMAGWIYRNVLERPGPMFQGLLVSKAVMEEIGYLDEQVVSHQEWDTAIRLAKCHPFSFIDAPTFVYDCRHPDSISKSAHREALGYEQVVRKHTFQMLLKTGPRVLARHYRFAAKRYGDAGSTRLERRARMAAFLWWPIRPHKVFRGLRALPRKFS